MKDHSLPRAGEFRNQFLLWSAVLSAGATLLISGYLTTLIRLTSEQWMSFGVIVGVLFVVLFFAQDYVNKVMWASVMRALEALEADEATPEIVREGFGAVCNLPMRMMWLGWGWYLFGGLLVGGAMWIRYESFTAFSYVVMVVAAVSGGFVATVFTFFMIKRILTPARFALGERIDDPVERAALINVWSISRKLRFSITGVTVFTVLFAVLCAHVRSMRPVEMHVSDLQSRLLNASVEAFAAGDPDALQVLRKQAVSLGIAEGILLIDTETGAIDGLVPENFDESLAWIAESGLEAGDSTRVESPFVISWIPIPDGRRLLAWSEWASIWSTQSSSLLVFVLLLVVSGVISFWLAWLTSSDVSHATSWLHAEAARMASGDLRKGRVFESEDELGSLARSFETMAGSLRTAVGGLAKTADQVEVTSVEMVQVAEAVAGVTTDQVQGIEQTSALMDQINGQVSGIAESAQALNVSVEESSSSILELGAAGEELNETASVLGEKVNEVSSSIEQMTRSVKQVSENTEGLAAAADETSASMGEMATSMREVDSSAEETARLSRQVVDAAESGQAKMVQTIGGMDAIREATETAEQVIRLLGGRASEIGAIVDVIDDVADETNLLALNAAIIAAQAGDQGRAFSVVADEIKDLADRVMVSTKEIGSLIRAVQDESENAIGAIEEGSQSVASGVDLAAAAGTSLEEITRASRESGQRIAGIVSAVREQAKAASYVVELMEHVRGGVEQIQTAAGEQDRGNEVVYRGSVAMKDVAQQVRGTTEEQARGSGRIRESVESVREAVEQINAALQEQTAACRSAVEFLEAMHGRTQTNEEAAKCLDRVAEDLVQQAEQLREDVRRFQI